MRVRRCARAVARAVCLAAALAAGAISWAQPQASPVPVSAAPKRADVERSRAAAEAMLERQFTFRTRHTAPIGAIDEAAHIHGPPVARNDAGPGVGVRSGVNYSVSHLLAYAAGGQYYPVFIYNGGLPGAQDDIVTFDGVEEPLRTDITGTVPLVTETSVAMNPWVTTLNITTRSGDGSDLFPSGYSINGFPLLHGVLLIGFDQELLWPGAIRVRAGTFRLYRDGLPISPSVPLPVQDFFPGQPWDGYTGVVFNNIAGQGVDRIEFTIVVDNSAAPDFDSDRDIDIADVNTFFQNMTRPTRPPTGDFDGNGEVNMRDFQTMQTACTTGSCSEYLLESGVEFLNWADQNTQFIRTADDFFDLLFDAVRDVLTEIGDTQRLEIMIYDRTRIRFEFRYFSEVQQNVFVMHFFDGRPPLKINYLFEVEHLEVWMTSYTERWILYRPVGSAAGDALARFRVWVTKLDKAFSVIGTVANIIALANPCRWTETLYHIGEMYADQDPGFCLPPCLCFWDQLAPASDLCLGQYGNAFQIGAYYSCIPGCFLIEDFFTTQQKQRIRQFYLNLYHSARVYFGCFNLECGG